jgi:hypothetical protein
VTGGARGARIEARQRVLSYVLYGYEKLGRVGRRAQDASVVGAESWQTAWPDLRGDEGARRRAVVHTQTRSKSMRVPHTQKRGKELAFTRGAIE